MTIRDIFRDDQDRDDFIGRLGAVAGATDLAIDAWALVPHRLPLVVRTGATSRARADRARWDRVLNAGQT
ncbi:MAG: hypothetical protein A2Z31_09415 [candidate division NC10 bacterium RBG_16_65_8]|nr:MAG: hypothetical protein A2Z31_09415 [candidate division NC10 bacterium RBG_16_65_8]